jgi:outer membrane protein assembly factor BamB
MNSKALLAAVLLAAPTLQSFAQEWARFRGNAGSAISEVKTIPAKLSASDVNWSLDLGGIGHSSPVAWGDKLFVTTSSESRGGLSVACRNADTGKELWKKTFALKPFRKHRYNSFASSTPVLDADNLYVGWSEPGKYTFVALTHAGEKVWERNLGPFASQHGSGASPTIYEGKIILNSMKDDDSFIIALNPKSGKTIWKTTRPSKVASYGSAAVYRPQGAAPQLVFTSQADGIFALDPDNGKQLWQMPGIFTKRSAGSVSVAGDIVWGSCGSGGGGNYVVAVRAGIPEKGIKPERAWEIRRSSLSPYVPTPVVQGKYAYLLSDAGFLSCINHQTGEIIYAERLNTTGSRGANFFSSPVIIDGRLYCLTTHGKLYVCQAGPEYRVISEFDFNDTCHSTPAVHRGRLYIRTAGKLFSIGG